MHILPSSLFNEKSYYSWYMDTFNSGPEPFGPPPGEDPVLPEPGTPSFPPERPADPIPATPLPPDIPPF